MTTVASRSFIIISRSSKNEMARKAVTTSGLKVAYNLSD